MAENVDEDKVTFDQMELDDRILKVQRTIRISRIILPLKCIHRFTGNSKIEMDISDNNSRESHSTIP